VVACDEAELAPLLESLRPLLSRYGGMCLVSDALWVRH
ncbi:MAG: transcriptional regulator, partial [Acidobacteria bacterium]|nr:transcriptional regulator [Acidobacteriota bacterium]MCC6133070.1 transcriptional regulator [Acidobacteriota bacterium]